MQKSYKFRLYPTKQQEVTLIRTIDVCRHIYNEFLADRRNAYDRCNQGLSTMEQLYQVQYLEFDTDVHSQVKQDVIRRLGKSFDAFFRRCKNGEAKVGYPRFKGKRRYNSFTYPQSGFSISGKKLKLSKIGEIKIVQHREIEGKIKTCTIRKDGKQWYVTFSVVVENNVTPVEPVTFVGIDVGLNSLVTLSDGTQINPPKYYRNTEGELKRQQRNLSRKKKFSNNWKKQCDKVNTLHRKIRNQRNDFNHKLSRELINAYDYIAFEDLNVKNMVKNSRLSKSIHDASWSDLIQITKYKAEEAGKFVELVNPYNTSQLCSNCGQKVEKSLAVRTHNCPHCGLVLDRDHNAAINILNRAVGTTVKACGIESLDSIMKQETTL
ncbi:RNA-guided endonuclease InsQ/TnpB family protein [Methanolobus bombayensis]|uniref:RNA-guided endonuclease InsQ/TnpB family protein n=1 Tax=Methanolobus bombayensis TaxID=38023 RepID=UPI001AE2F8BE|nr:RNA-guided endonuclease TnpB family protein [Methanolobus bombayensis]